MPNTPPRLILEGWFSLLIPAGWTWNEEEGVTCIYQAETGAGSINISLFYRPAGAPASPGELAEQAMNFAQNLGVRLSQHSVKPAMLDRSPGSYIECQDNTGDYWRVWHAARDQRLVLLAYNCPVAEVAREQATIDKIVKSFTWEEPKKPSTPAGASNGRHGK